MGLDLDAFSKEAKARYIETGRQFSSEQTLKQANRTFKALAKHGEALKPFGFIPRDGERLKDALDMLKGIVDARHGTRTSKKGATRDAQKIITEGLRTREQVRAALNGAEQDLLDQGATEAHTALQVALESTSQGTDVIRPLAVQLKTLAGAVGLEAVKPLVIERVGEPFIEALQARIGELDALASERDALSPGTPEVTERLDLLDGIIVSIARRARTCAESASKALSEPSILTAFALDKLYKA